MDVLYGDMGKQPGESHLLWGLCAAYRVNLWECFFLSLFNAAGSPDKGFQECVA